MCCIPFLTTENATYVLYHRIVNIDKGIWHFIKMIRAKGTISECMTGNVRRAGRNKVPYGSATQEN